MSATTEHTAPISAGQLSIQGAQFRRVRKNRNNLPRLVAVGLVLAVTVVILIAGNMPRHAVHVVVDMSLPVSGTAQVFKNEASKADPTVLAVAPGRNSYDFELPPGVWQIRLDPINQARVPVEIHSISFTQDGRSLLQMGSADLARLSGVNTGPITETPLGIKFTTITADAYVASPVNLQGQQVPPLLWTMLTYAFVQPKMLGPMALGFTFLLMAAAWAWRRPSRLLVLAAPWPILYLCATWFWDHQDPADVSQAVGTAAYSGWDPTVGETSIAVAGLLTILVAGVSVFLDPRPTWAGYLRARASWRVQFASVFRRSRRAEEPAHADREERPRFISTIAKRHGSLGASVDPKSFGHALRSLGGRISRASGPQLVSTVLVAASALSAVPDFKQIDAAIRTGHMFTQWDTQNFYAWWGLVARGFVPMRDFWYPYGNRVLDPEQFRGVMLNWLFVSMALSGLSISIMALAGKRNWRGPLAVALLCAVVLSHQVGDFSRYGLPLAAVSLVAVFWRGSRLAWLGIICVAWLPFLAIDLGLYASVGFFVVLIVSEATQRPRDSLRSRLRRLAAPCVILTLGWFLSLASFVARGQLAGQLSLFVHPQESVAYSATPNAIAPRLIDVTAAGLVELLLPMVLLSMTTYWVVRQLRIGEHTNSRLAPLVSGIAAIGLLMVQKDVARALGDSLLLIIFLVVCIGAVAIPPGSRRWVTDLLAAIVSCCLIGQLGVLPGAIQKLGWAAQSISRDISFALDAGEQARLDEYRFSEQRAVADYPDEVALTRSINTTHPGARPFVLGDAPLIYMLDGQKPYWGINGYNNSPIRTQRQVLGELTASPPGVVVLDTRDTSFDGVPPEVRTPLIYDWAVAGWAFSYRVGPFDVLTPKPANAPVDLDYWRQALGTETDWGLLPFATTVGSADACVPVKSPNAQDCVPIIEVSLVSPQRQAGGLSVFVKTPAGIFENKVTQRPGDQKFVVPINRLWWAPYSAGSVSAKLAGGPDSVTVRWVLPDRNRLY